MSPSAIGWIIAVLSCYGSEYNCKVSAYENPPTVYETEHDCEWSLSGMAAPYDKDSRLECVKVVRPSN